MNDSEKRIKELEKENAELKLQLEERQMCLCIPLEKIKFTDPYLEKNKNQVPIQSIKEELRHFEESIGIVTID